MFVSVKGVHRRVGAVLFDVDGTLYRQAPLRSAMALELASHAVRSPRRAPTRWRALQAYRRAQERLRLSPPPPGGPASAQLAEASDRSGMPLAEVDRLVTEWMFVRPLKYLRWCRAAGLDDLLALLDRAAVRIGVLSDYPAHDKLAALGLAGRFAPVLSAADREVGVFKPHPRGFLRAAQIWNIDPAEVLVVGDRVDADASGARAAGMVCAIVGETTAGAPPDVIAVPSLGRLCHVLDCRG